MTRISLSQRMIRRIDHDLGKNVFRSVCGSSIKILQNRRGEVAAAVSRLSALRQQAHPTLDEIGEALGGERDKHENRLREVEWQGFEEINLGQAQAIRVKLEKKQGTPFELAIMAEGLKQLETAAKNNQINRIKKVIRQITSDLLRQASEIERQISRFTEWQQA